jgi:hypothetical protein
MQLFDDELAMYDMQLVTSKCLNTAVLIMYMLLGEAALEHTSFCDVINVHSKYKNKNFSLPQVNKFKKQILSLDVRSTRSLYYIMITDGAVQRQDSEDFLVFPGHVSIIEKLVDVDGLPKFNLYQSYVTKYNLDDHIKMNDRTLEYSYFEIVEFVNNIVELFNSGVWTMQTTRCWLKFIHVNEERFDGFDFKKRIFFCFREVHVDTCASILVEKLNAKKKKLEKGDYIFTHKVRHLWGHEQLDNAELLANVNSLLTKLKNM